MFQNTLLVIGTTALGSGFGALALHLGLSMLATEPKGENFGGALFWIGMICCGGMLGGCGGFGGAVGWIARHESRTWSPLVWIGAALGLVVGLFVSFRFPDRRLELWFWLLCAAFIVPACSAVGGLLASLAVACQRRNMKR